MHLVLLQEVASFKLPLYLELSISQQSGTRYGTLNIGDRSSKKIYDDEDGLSRRVMDDRRHDDDQSLFLLGCKGKVGVPLLTHHPRSFASSIVIISHTLNLFLNGSTEKEGGEKEAAID